MTLNYEAPATQLYAKIKRTSQYFTQNEYAKRDGQFPFRVTFQSDTGGYVVKGGPGGCYRLRDVNLFVIVNGLEVRIK